MIRSTKLGAMFANTDIPRRGCWIGMGWHGRIFIFEKRVT